MKKPFFFLTIACVVTIQSQAKIWRVNNNAGVTADFTTVQAAHNGALAGDTLHLEPSTNSYGDLSMSKRLTIISTGAFLSQNPGYQSDIRAGFMGTLNINNTGANNSVIMIRFVGDINVNNGVSSILLSNCASFQDCGFTCQSININNADNIIVKQCAVGSVNYVNNSNGIIVSNNLVLRSISSDINSDAIITNNVINLVNTSLGPNSFNNSIITNNIFKINNTMSFANCTVSNNLSAGNNLPAGNGNLNNVLMSDVFVNSAAGFIDNAYLLKAGSPAIGAGVGGIDCGAFGGTTPFKLAVTPPIPSIYQFIVPATSSGNTMNITFSARSNN